MYVKVTVAPGSKNETIVETAPRTFAITVREPAEQNRANTRVRELLARHFKVPLGHVRILTGHRSRGKMVSIDN